MSPTGETPVPRGVGVSPKVCSTTGSRQFHGPPTGFEIVPPKLIAGGIARIKHPDIEAGRVAICQPLESLHQELLFIVGGLWPVQEQGILGRSLRARPNMKGAYQDRDKIPNLHRPVVSPHSHCFVKPVHHGIAFEVWSRSSNCA